jgi:hypothetical protein
MKYNYYELEIYMIIGREYAQDELKRFYVNEFESNFICLHGRGRIG